MKKSTITTSLIMIVLVGLVCGPGMLDSAHAARPPFDWPSVFLCFFGLLFGLPFVISIQLFRSDPKYAQSAIACFVPVAIFLVSSGLSAFALGLYREGFTPQSVFFFAGGVGMLIAVGFCKALCQIKVKKQSYQVEREGNPTNQSPGSDA